MRKIQGHLTNELAKKRDPKDVAGSEPFFVPTFLELVRHSARLSYANSDYILFFRGQRRDFLNKAGKSTFYPSIYRDDLLRREELQHRFRLLENASRTLADAFADYNIEGAQLIRRKQYIRWAILQHYEVCSTPMLDFTQSLRVACSFALLNNMTDVAYVYVFGDPAP